MSYVRSTHRVWTRHSDENHVSRRKIPGVLSNMFIMLFIIVGCHGQIRQALLALKDAWAHKQQSDRALYAAVLGLATSAKEDAANNIMQKSIPQALPSLSNNTETSNPNLQECDAGNQLLTGSAMNHLHILMMLGVVGILFACMI